MKDRVPRVWFHGDEIGNLGSQYRCTDGDQLEIEHISKLIPWIRHMESLGCSVPEVSYAFSTKLSTLNVVDEVYQG